MNRIACAIIAVIIIAFAIIFDACIIASCGVCYLVGEYMGYGTAGLNKPCSHI